MRRVSLYRAHRIGQKREVLTIRFVTPSSVEEQILHSAELKLDKDALVIKSGMYNGELQDRETERQEQSVFYRVTGAHSCRVCISVLVVSLTDFLSRMFSPGPAFFYLVLWCLLSLFSPSVLWRTTLSLQGECFWRTLHEKKRSWLCVFVAESGKSFDAANNWRPTSPGRSILQF